MPLIIPDDVLKSAGLTERQAAIEIACRLYAAGVLEWPQAVRLAGVARGEFEAACAERDVTAYRYTDRMISEELDAAARLEAKRAGRQ